MTFQLGIYAEKYWMGQALGLKFGQLDSRLDFSLKQKLACEFYRLPDTLKPCGECRASRDLLL